MRISFHSDAFASAYWHFKKSLEWAGLEFCGSVMDYRALTIAIVLSVVWMLPSASAEESSPIKIAFIAGPDSREYAQHEHNGGLLFLADYLERFVSEKEIWQDGRKAPKIITKVFCDVRPDDPAFADPFVENADVLVVFADGAQCYPLAGHTPLLYRMKNAGKGFVVLHFALCATQTITAEPPLERSLDEKFIREAIGGVYETFHSINPFFTAEVEVVSGHPIARGVGPFAIWDEWYYNMRFINDLCTDEILDPSRDTIVKAILKTVPPDATRQRPDGAHSGNPYVRSRTGKPEILAWAIERQDGGRGFGFTGGDQHVNWAHPDFRKVILNGIVWVAGLDIPQQGIATPSPSLEELLEHLKQPNAWSSDREQSVRAMIDDWNR